MLNNPILRQHQKLLSWGLLIVLLLAIIFLFIIPVVQKSLAVDQQIENGYSQLAKFRQIAHATPEFMAEYQRVQEQGLDKLFAGALVTLPVALLSYFLNAKLTFIHNKSSLSTGSQG